MGLDLIILATIVPAIIVIGAILARRERRHDDHDDHNSPGSHLG